MPPDPPRTRDSPHADFLFTKIVSTVGPATENVSTLLSMIKRGARVFRVNFSHGSFDDFERMLGLIRSAESAAGLPIGVLGDLPGPKIRLGDLPEPIDLPRGSRVHLFGKGPDVSTIHSGSDGSDQPIRLTTNYDPIADEVTSGQRILIDDGNVSLRCDRVSDSPDGRYLECTVLVGGRVSSKKGVNLPDTNLSVPSLTERDIECVDFAVHHGFDFLALSFVRASADVRRLKDRLRQLGARPAAPKRPGGGGREWFSAYGGGTRSFIPIVAKIEKPEALNDIEGIIDEADAVMVARGDLGVEMDLARVPVVQKRLLRLCHDFGKPVIVATQMLQSMIESPTPTRAEASDVANAIFDGADAVMLSGETAVGRWPRESVDMMRRIARETQDHLRTEGTVPNPPKRPRESRYRTAALAHGVSVVVRDLDAKLVAMWSELGGGASYMAQHHLPVPVLAFSAEVSALRRMSVLYGLTPILMERPETTAGFIERLDRMILDHGWAEPHDAIVLVLGEPIATAGLTNKIRIHYLGDL